MIDFSKILVEEMPEFKGGTGITRAKKFLTENIKIMNMSFRPGDSIGLHTHDTNCEVIYVLSGKARCVLDGVTEIVEVGQVHYCPKGHEHSLACEGDEELQVLAIIPEQ